MIEAGSDARIRNKAKLTAAQLVDPSNVHLRKQLEDAVESGDFIGDDGGRDALGLEEKDESEDGDVGSASDSDFDEEEYKRERERRRKVGNGSA